MLKRIKFAILISWLIFLTLPLVSCGGGGGGGSGPSLAITANVADANNNSTSQAYYSNAKLYKDEAEYKLQKGLAQVNTAEAYAYLNLQAKTVAGGGVTVGAVDGGAYNHNELKSKLVDSNAKFPNNHGTHIAGIIGASRNGSGIYGVAFDSKINVVDVFLGQETATTRDITNAIDKILTEDVKIINLSFGNDTGNSYTDSNCLGNNCIIDNTYIANVYSLYQNTFLNTVNNNALLIFAAGNDGDKNYPDPSLPAIFSAKKIGNLNSVLSGNALAVVSVDANNIKSDFSNSCGLAKDFCLAAPGENIVSLAYDANNPNALASASGTSMAAPHVSGAAAVLKGAWPNLTGSQIADILLKTATDLGAVGVDEIYGRGMLNLEQAVKAYGTNNVPLGATIYDRNFVLNNNSTFFTTDPLLGSQMQELKDAVEKTIFFDDYFRDYKANISNDIVKSGNNIFSLEQIIFNPNSKLVAGNNYNNENAKINFNFGKHKLEAVINPSVNHYDLGSQSLYLMGHGLFGSENKKLFNYQANFNNLINDGNVSYRNFSTNFTAKDLKITNLDLGNLSLGFANNLLQAQNNITNYKSDLSNISYFYSQQDFWHQPQQKLISARNINLQELQSNNQLRWWRGGVENINNFRQLSLNYQLPNSQNSIVRNLGEVMFSTSYQDSYRDSQQHVSSQKNSSNVDFNLLFNNVINKNFDAKLLLNFGYVSEFNKSFLNNQASAIFLDGNKARSDYGKLAFEKIFATNWQIFGSYFYSKTNNINSDFAIIRQINGLKSKGFSLGFAKNSVFNRLDSFGFSYQQPLHLTKGYFLVDVPVAIDQNFNIIRERSKISAVSPNNQENFELFYRYNSPNDYSIKFNNILVKNANNIRQSNQLLSLIEYRGYF
jgi:hypothetical protein